MTLLPIHSWVPSLDSIAAGSIDTKGPIGEQEIIGLINEKVKLYFIEDWEPLGSSIVLILVNNVMAAIAVSDGAQCK